MPRNIISLQFDLNVSFHNSAKQGKYLNQIIFCVFLAENNF